MTDLKPCPFCGAIPTLEEKDEFYRVGCQNIDGCGMCVHTPWFDGKKEVIEWWNRWKGE